MQISDMKCHDKDQNALERLEKIKLDQKKRMEALEIEMNQLKLHAELVELHADDVDKAVGVINSAIGLGMDLGCIETKQKKKQSEKHVDME